MTVPCSMLDILEGKEWAFTEPCNTYFKTSLLDIYSGTGLESRFLGAASNNSGDLFIYVCTIRGGLHHKVYMLHKGGYHLNFFFFLYTTSYKLHFDTK